MTHTAVGATRSDTVGWGGLAAVGAGAMAIVEVVSPADGAVGSALFLAFLVLLAGGLLGLHALQRSAYGRLGTVAFAITLAGVTAQAIAAGGGVVGAQGLQPLDDAGSLLLLVGFTVYGAVTARAGLLPRWCGVAIPVAFIGWVAAAVALGDLGSVVGGLWLGVVWITLGWQPPVAPSAE